MRDSRRGERLERAGWMRFRESQTDPRPVDLFGAVAANKEALARTDAHVPRACRRR